MAAELKAESMKRYGVPVAKTEQSLIQLMSPPTPPPDSLINDAPIGRKKKS